MLQSQILRSDRCWFDKIYMIKKIQVEAEMIFLHSNGRFLMYKRENLGSGVLQHDKL